MQCAQHFESSAVGTCRHCGRGLCPDCVAVFSPPSCGPCALNHNAGVASALYWQLALMAVLFGGTFAWLLTRTGGLSALGYALMAGFFPAGWCFLGRYFSPGGGYRRPLARWMHLGAQAGVAAMLGMVLGPVQLYHAWRELKTVSATRELLAGDAPSTDRPAS